jgi:hypothetical protein
MNIESHEPWKIVFLLSGCILVGVEKEITVDDIDA